MKQTKSKKLLISLLLGLLLFVNIVLPMAMRSINSYAATVKDEQGYVDEERDNEIQPRAFTTLSVSVNGGEGNVWATVRNDFTLFPSTVLVIVELYSSLTYTDNYNKMTLEAINQIDDLDMGNTVSAIASTGGVDKYWLGRVKYNDGSTGGWKYKDTGCCKISASGEFLGYI